MRLLHIAQNKCWCRQPSLQRERSYTNLRPDCATVIGRVDLLFTVALFRLLPMQDKSERLAPEHGNLRLGQLGPWLAGCAGRHAQACHHAGLAGGNAGRAPLRTYIELAIGNAAQFQFC